GTRASSHPPRRGWGCARRNAVPPAGCAARNRGTWRDRSGRARKRGALAAELLDRQPLRQLEVAAAGVRELHLPRGLTLGLEQAGASDDFAGAARARRGDVEAVEAVKELDAARGAGGGRRRPRIDPKPRLRPMKSVDGADPCLSR